MERNTFNISVLVRKQKVNKNGLSTIEIYLSQNGKKTYIATPVKISPDEFKRDMISKKSNNTKSYVQSLHTSINAIISQLQTSGEEWDIYTIKERYTAKTDVITLERVYEEFIISIFNQHKAGMITRGTYLKYKVMWQYIQDYNTSIKFKPDTSIRLINESWGDGLQTFLLTSLQSTTSAGIMNKTKQLFHYAEKKNYIGKSPINDVKVVKKTKEVSFLTEKEVSKIYNTHIPIERLNNVKNLFIIQCLTGLAFADLTSITPADIKEDNGTYYIQKARKKTGVVYTIVLFPQVLDIFKQYNFRLPFISNQKYNKYLKEIQEYCKIETTLHSHLARHTAATLLLNKGMTIDVVSKVLGHTNVKQTQHYSKLLQTTIYQQFKEVQKRLKVCTEPEPISVTI